MGRPGWPSPSVEEAGRRHVAIGRTDPVRVHLIRRFERRRAWLFSVRLTDRVTSPFWIAGTTRDVTDRELARASVQHSEQLLSQIFDAAPAFMAVLRGPDMVFEKANDGYRELVGAGRALM